jgi:hypothetical protein
MVKGVRQKLAEELLSVHSVHLKSAHAREGGARFQMANDGEVGGTVAKKGLVLFSPKKRRGASMNEERRRELEASTSLGETSLWIDYADVYGDY